MAPVHQRCDGEALIRFECAAGCTRLKDLYHRAPCHVLFPATPPNEPTQAVLLTTSGGLTGGDRIRIAADVGAGGRATFTAQAAEKIYRALPASGEAVVHVEMRVGAGAWSEWLAQETILFEGSRLRRLFAADVDPGGRLLALETTVFGRRAMGERYATGMLHDAWRIRRGGALIWADALHLAGDLRGLRGAAFGFGTSVACSTVVYVGPDAACQLEEARRLLRPCPLPAAATALDGLLLVRLMADDALELRSAVIAVVAGLRHAAAGLAPRLPRVWQC